MIKYTEEELLRLQTTELEMLIEFDRICRKHDIRYSLDSGTLLGAIRHEGFIPWDDDIDVTMLRCEYRKFRRAAKKDLDKERFFLQDRWSDKNYRWGYPKLRRNGTAFVREGQEHIKCNNGIFMDILVVDNVPDSERFRKKHLKACEYVRACMYSAVGKFSESDPDKRKRYEKLSRVPRWLFFFYRDLLAFSASWKRTELVSHLTLPYAPGTYGVPRECFDETVDVDFEGCRFRAFKKWDLYLGKLYGDYMALPSVKEPHLAVSDLKFTDLTIPLISSRTPEYTKEDRIIPKEWENIVMKADGSRKKIICYGISIYALLKDQKAFLEKLKKNLLIFRESSDKVALVLRPQALIREWMPERLPKIRKDYETIINEYKAAGFGIFDESSRPETIVSCSDAYYGDWCSIVWWFWQEKKPIMIENVSLDQGS